jgi:hypothetical protein
VELQRSGEYDGIRRGSGVMMKNTTTGAAPTAPIRNARD